MSFNSSKLISGNQGGCTVGMQDEHNDIKNVKYLSMYPVLGEDSLLYTSWNLEIINTIK